MDGQPTASTGDLEQPRAQCDGCGQDLDERESPVVYDCFHALHAGCTYGSDDACPLPYCLAPRTRPSAPEVGAAGQLRGGPNEGRRPIRRSPWSSSLGGPFGSPSPSHVDQFEQPPPATAGPAAPPQPAYTGPFEQPPANHLEFGPLPAHFGAPPPAHFGAAPPAQFGAAPPYFNNYYTGMFQQPPPAPAVPYAFVSPRPTQTGQFAGCPAPSQAAAPFQQPPPLPSQAAFGSPYYSAFSPVAPPPPPPSHYPLQTSTFEYHHHHHQQPPPAPAPAPAPARFAYAPAAAPGSPSSCAACGGAVVRGQTAVTSQCNHTFHFRCFAGSAYACPACGAQWRDVGPVPQPPPYRY